MTTGLCDGLRMGIMPILLGDGLRLFEHIDGAQLTLDKIRVFEAGPRIDMWYRIIR